MIISQVCPRLVTIKGWAQVPFIVTEQQLLHKPLEQPSFHCMRTDLSVQLEVKQVDHAFCLTVCTETGKMVAIETRILSQQR